jgi:signal transduction histidine kinase
VARLERLFAEIEWPDRRRLLQARRAARKRAIEVLDAGGPSDDTSQMALLVASAELFGRLRAELTDSPEDAAWLVAQIEEIGVARLALAREVLRSPELVAMSAAAAIDAQLTMLTVLAPLRGASLWTLDDTEQIHCVRHAGEGNPTRAAKQLAQEILAGEGAESAPRRVLLGVPVGRWRRPIAALVGSAEPGTRDVCQSFLAEAVAMMGAILERDALLVSNAASERALVESSERKLTRLGFDLHDGPIQDVAVVAEDLREFRDQIDKILKAGHRKLVRGRLKELESQLLSLDVDLRRISNEVRAASILLNRPFRGALQDVAQAFAARTSIHPRLAVDGETSSLSASQQIALLNIIHESLSNIREHSSATEVKILVSVNAKGVEARVIDNGRGFDLEATLARAAREGRLGLVAMHERVRLLGGQCRIDSRRGGPTVISVSLQRWEPLEEAVQSTRVAPR